MEDHERARPPDDLAAERHTDRAQRSADAAGSAALVALIATIVSRYFEAAFSFAMRPRNVTPPIT